VKIVRRKTEPQQNVLRQSTTLRGRRAERLQPEGGVVDRIEPGRETWFLKHECASASRIADFAGGLPQGAGGQSEKRRLAAAGWPKQGDEFVRRHMQGNVRQHRRVERK